MNVVQTPLGDMPAIDAHAHVFPEPLFDAIWRFFEKNYWHINYKLYGSQIAHFYRDQGFVGFTTLNYAHKPGISSMMNEYTWRFCEQHPHAIPFGTLHPGDKDLLKLAELCLTSYGFRGFKFQLLVTDFYIHDSRLLPVYDLIRREDKVLVFHAGTGPAANPYVGIKHFRKFAENYGDLRVQIAHLGSFEYEAFLALLTEHPTFYLDTAMMLVDHRLFPSHYPPGIQKLLEYEDQILFGSDFPNIPYDFKESWKTLFSYNLPKSFYEKIMYGNAKTLYRI